MSSKYLFVPALLALLAWGGPANAQEVEHGPLAKTILKDIECYHTFIKTVGKAIKEEKSGQMGEKCNKHYQQGLKVYQQAKKHYKKGNALKAYELLFAAKKRLRPCFLELFEQGISDELKATIAEQIKFLASQLGETEKFIQENVKDESKSRKARGVFKKAKKHYTQAQAYNKQGKQRKAWDEFVSAQRLLHQAIIFQLRFYKKKKGL